jgi:hypothetical protein
LPLGFAAVTPEDHRLSEPPSNWEAAWREEC